MSELAKISIFWPIKSSPSREAEISAVPAYNPSLYHLYSLGETQILTDLNLSQNEELFH